LLIRRVPEAWLSVAAYKYDAVTCTSLALAEKSDASILQVMLGLAHGLIWGFFTQPKSLEKARLVPKEVSLSLFERAIDRTNRFVMPPSRSSTDSLENGTSALPICMGLCCRKPISGGSSWQGAVLLKAKLRG